MESKFWKDKKTLITGHTGFKGSWLCLLLKILGAKIVGYSLKPKKISLFNIAFVKKVLHKNFYGDICDLKKIKFTGYFCLSGYGEPTLHKNIFNMIDELSSVGPVEIVTNGDTLSVQSLIKFYQSKLFKFTK